LRLLAPDTPPTPLPHPPFSGAFGEAHPDGVAALVAALAAEAAKPAPAATAGKAAAGDPPSFHLFTAFYSSRALRRLALAGLDAGPGRAGARGVVAALWAAGGKGRAAGWVGTHADKVLAAFWKGGDEGVRGDVEAELAAAGVHDAAEWAAPLLRAGAGE